MGPSRGEVPDTSVPGVSPQVFHTPARPKAPKHSQVVHNSWPFRTGFPFVSTVEGPRARARSQKRAPYPSRSGGRWGLTFAAPRENALRRLTETALILFCLVLAPLARADDKAGPPPGRQSKPAQALVDAFNGMVGTWACSAKFQKMDGTGTTDSQSTMVVSAMLDGYGYTGVVTVEKNARLPRPLQQQFYWTYNAATKTLVELVADNYGDIGQGTSPGLSGDTVIWTEESVMMGRATQSRTTVKKVSPTEVSLTFDAQADGKWATFGTKSCKKM